MHPLRRHRLHSPGEQRRPLVCSGQECPSGWCSILLLNTYWPWRRGSSESGSMVDGPNSGNRPRAFLLVKLFDSVADMHCILTFGCLEGEHQSRSYCAWSNTSPLSRHPTPVKSRQESKDVQAVQLDEHGNEDIELRQPWHVRLMWAHD
jgi:hypothetical protein